MNAVRGEKDIVINGESLIVLTQETKLIVPFSTIDHVKYFSREANTKKLSQVDTIRIYTKDHVEIDAIRIEKRDVALKLLAVLQEVVNENQGGTIHE